MSGGARAAGGEPASGHPIDLLLTIYRKANRIKTLHLREFHELGRDIDDLVHLLKARDLVFHDEMERLYARIGELSAALLRADAATIPTTDQETI